MIEAIIAIISTVIGTILGWILGNVNFGKLYVSLTDEKVKAFYINPETMNIPDKKDYELYGVNINFTTWLLG